MKNLTSAFKLYLTFLLLLLFQSQLFADGLTGNYYNNRTFTAPIVMTRVDSTIDFDWGNGNPGGGVSSDNFSVEWTGFIHFPENANYTFSLAHDDEVELIIDGVQLHSSTTWTGRTGGIPNFIDASTFHYDAGHYPITIRFVERSGGAFMKLAWRNDASIATRTIVPTTNLFTTYVVNAPPVLSDATFNVDETATNTTAVGTVLASNAPTSFTILSGNIGGVFGIDNNGNITIANNTNLDFETTSTYSLQVQASNAFGDSTSAATITIDINDIDEKLTCPGEPIPNLDGATASESYADAGNIVASTTYYYYFTPLVKGTIQVDSIIGDGGTSNSLYIKDGCATGNIWSLETATTNKSSPEIDVNANQLIVIALERRHTTDKPFSIDFTYTALTPEAVDDTATTDWEEPIAIDILGNDTRVLADTVQITTDVTNGSTTVNPTTGSVTYIPDLNFVGTDFFTYSVKDDLNNTLTAVVTITVTAPETTYDTGFHPFELVNLTAQNVVGGYEIAGNTVMCLVNKTTTYGTAADPCLDGVANQSLTSNLRISKYIDIDGDAATWNSTSSYITIPDTYDVSRGIIWAGLFWQGRISNSTDFVKRFGIENGGGFNLISTGKDSGYGDIDIEAIEANKIKLKIDSGSYKEILAKTLYSVGNDDARTYSAYANVTRHIQEESLGVGKHTFTVANLTTNEGREGSPGVFGGWSLVVIYLEDLLQGQARNISIYNGLLSIGTNDAPISISGFKLPSKGKVTSKLSVFSGEGEYLYGRHYDADGNDNGDNTSDDWMKISNNPTTGFAYMPGATYQLNMFDGVLDGITRDNVTGFSNNLQLNNDGVDIDTYDVSSIMEAYRDSDTNIDEIFIKFYSDNDYITPGMVAFSAELYVPRMCYDYTYRQDGFSYTEENNGTQSPHIVIPTNSGNRIDAKILIRSLDGDVDFSHVSIYSDFNVSKVLYKPGYFSMTDIDASYYDPKSETVSTNGCNEAAATNVLCTDNENFRAGLGRGATGYPLFNAGAFSDGEEMRFKFSLTPQNHDPLDTPLNLYVDIQYRLADGSGGDLAPVYGIPLGDPRRMSLCPPSASYNPEWGILNTIDTQINLNRTGQTGSEFYNNLLTQVSSRPFSIDVVSLDAADNPPTKPQDRNTSVSVEIFDATEMHDINNTCNDHDPSLVLSRVVHLNFNDNNRSRVPDMSSANAIQSAAMRVWYMHDGNRSHIISNWSAATNSDGTLQSISSDLYDQIPGAPALCSSDCTDKTTVTCYDCLKQHFSYALCSRDNFSIRPESYNVVIEDGNISDPYDIEFQIVTNTDINATARLAADYGYNMEINATNHLDNNSTRGYKQIFNADTTSALAQLKWVVPADIKPDGVSCNDESNTSLVIPIINGVANDVILSKDNVGYYELNITDLNWTGVDQGINTFAPQHHIDNPGFILDVSDCRSNSHSVDDDNISFFTPAELRNTRQVGCHISTSSHVVDTQVSNRTPVTYKDINISFHPYSLDLTDLIVSHGPDMDTDFNATANNEEVFIYMADRNETNESNMALNAMGSINARGKNGLILSNYVGGCYAEDINITLLTVLPTCDPMFFGHRLINLDVNGTVITDMNLSSEEAITVELDDMNFTKELNGTMNIRLHYNYDKNETNLTMNPKRLNIQGLNVDCNTTANCTISAEQSNNYSISNIAPINNLVNFVQGRVHAPRYRIDGNEGNVTVYHEIYWDGNAACNLNGVLINPALSVDSLNWYRNTRHTPEDGNVTQMTQQRGLNLITEQQNWLLQDGRSIHDMFYNGNNGYPYRSVIQITPSPWLIYNRYDSNATFNRLDIEFNQKGTATSGMVDDNAEVNSNRRIMW
jgi:hypothetical protein